MKNKHINSILIFVFIFAIGYIIVEKISNVEITFPIDSEKEAIAYAKTDPDVQNIMEKWSKPGTKLQANLHEKTNIWTVVIDIDDDNLALPLVYIISFETNGTIYKYY